MAIWNKTKAQMDVELLDREAAHIGGQLAQQKALMVQQAMMNNAAIANNALTSGAYQNAYASVMAGGGGGAGAAGQSMTGVLSGISAKGMVSNSTPIWKDEWKNRTPRFDPNKVPAMQMSMSALVDLCRVKHGDTWIDPDQFGGEDTSFWIDGLARLERAGKMEIYDGWMRLKEDV